MAIDTEAKRRSVIALSTGGTLPMPSGTVDAAARTTLAWTYAFTFSPPPVSTFVVRARRRRAHAYSRWSNRVPN